MSDNLAVSSPDKAGEAGRLPTPTTFDFPYPNPYPIQLDLMQTVFRAIEDRKIAIVRYDSPKESRLRSMLMSGRIAHWNWKIIDSFDINVDMARGKRTEND